MADPELVKILQQGSEVWNSWRAQQPEVWDSWREQYPGSRLLDLSNVDLRQARLRGVNLLHAHLDGANLYGADLRESNLHESNLSHANLSKADLSQADLRYVLMKNVNLREANLEKADLNETNLEGANLSSAYLNQANLCQTNLSRAILSHTDLREADLIYADLGNANLSFTKLAGADLSGATLYETAFTHIDLREVRGLSELRHLSFSSIDLHSVQLPQNGSALCFLRGTGVPDEWIDFYHAQITHPIQYHSCFISYSSQDDTLARRLHTDLQASGVRCWFAPEDLKIGSKFRQRIDEAIHLQDKLLVLLSEHSIASTWVESEVEAAMEKENRQQREVLFPVRLDDVVMQTSHAWAAMLRRTRHIGDFTSWANPQAYQGSFERLLRDLKAESGMKGETDGKLGAS